MINEFANDNSVAQKPIIKFEDVAKDFGDLRVLEHLNLEVARGELFVLVGASGSGKTTTLKMINGLNLISDGYLYINGKRQKDYNLQKLRWNIGYVLQQIALFPNMTVAQNIAVIPDMIGMNKNETLQKTKKLLNEVGLNPEKFLKRYPRELSGGEKQRVGILRALIFEPEIILMDEPFSALDPLSRTQLQEIVKELHQNKPDTTIVFVTHDMNEALKLGDKIAVMKDGKIVEVGTPQKLINQPEHEYTKSFFAGANVNLENTLLETPLKVLIQNDFLSEKNSSNSSFKGEAKARLDETKTIRDAIEAFASADIIEVQRHNQTIGYLTRQRLLEAETKLEM